jgi:polysaccharide biosynthesis protein PslH
VTGEILFLAHRTPYPPDRGDKIRSWNILKRLAKIAPVHVAALLDPEDTTDDLQALRNVAASLTLVPCAKSKLKGALVGLATGQSASVAALRSSGFQARVDALLAGHPIQAIYAYSGQMAQFVRPGGKVRFVMDFVDMDSAKFATFAEQGRGLVAWANAQESVRLLQYEKNVSEYADLALFVSEAEAALFRAKTGLGPEKVRALDNGIDLDRYTPNHPIRVSMGTAEGSLIVFTGQMDYRPNVDAVTAFARETLPLIRALLPDTSFAIVGRAPTPAVTALADFPGVIITGAVPDTRDWIARADVVVAPLKLARGIQNKVLEAMAMAKPVVASTPAAEGIDAAPGTELLIADSPREQADAILTLFANPAKAKALAQAARARMEARYGWDATLADLPHIMGMA